MYMYMELSLPGVPYNMKSDNDQNSRVSRGLKVNSYIPLSFLLAVVAVSLVTVSLVSSLADLRCSVWVLQVISPFSVSTVLIISSVPNSVSLNFKLLPVNEREVNVEKMFFLLFMKKSSWIKTISHHDITM